MNVAIREYEAFNPNHFCSICLDEEVTENTVLKGHDVTPVTNNTLHAEAEIAEKVSHIFHEACLEEWLKRDNSCPLCRESFEHITEEENTFTFNSVCYLATAMKLKNWVLAAAGILIAQNLILEGASVSGAVSLLVHGGIGFYISQAVTNNVLTLNERLCQTLGIEQPYYRPFAAALTCAAASGTAYALLFNLLSPSSILWGVGGVLSYWAVSKAKTENYLTQEQADVIKNIAVVISAGKALSYPGTSIAYSLIGGGVGSAIEYYKNGRLDLSNFSIT